MQRPSLHGQACTGVTGAGVRGSATDREGSLRTPHAPPPPRGAAWASPGFRFQKSAPPFRLTASPRAARARKQPSFLFHIRKHRYPVTDSEGRCAERGLGAAEASRGAGRGASGLGAGRCRLHGRARVRACARVAFLVTAAGRHRDRGSKARTCDGPTARPPQRGAEPRAHVAPLLPAASSARFVRGPGTGGQRQAAAEQAPCVAAESPRAASPSGMFALSRAHVQPARQWLLSPKEPWPSLSCRRRRQRSGCFACNMPRASSGL